MRRMLFLNPPAKDQGAPIPECSQHRVNPVIDFIDFIDCHVWLHDPLGSLHNDRYWAIVALAAKGHALGVSVGLSTTAEVHAIIRIAMRIDFQHGSFYHFLCSCHAESFLPLVEAS